MEYYFRIDEKYQQARTEQTVDIYDAFTSFIESEIRDCGPEDKLCEHLGIEVPFDGSVGLGFGFLIENSNYRIYRLWSRALYYSK